MKCFVYKPRRRKDGKSVVSRVYHGRYRLEDDKKFTEVALQLSDKQSARIKLEEIVKRVQQERAGVIPTANVRQAFGGLLLDHLKDFAAEMRRLGRDDRYVKQRESALKRWRDFSCPIRTSRDG